MPIPIPPPGKLEKSPYSSSLIGQHRAIQLTSIVDLDQYAPYRTLHAIKTHSNEIVVVVV